MGTSKIFVCFKTYKYFIWRLTERIFKVNILCSLFDLIKTRGRKVGVVKKSCLQIFWSLSKLSFLLVTWRFQIFVFENKKMQKVKLDKKEVVSTRHYYILLYTRQIENDRIQTSKGMLLMDFASEKIHHERLLKKKYIIIIVVIIINRKVKIWIRRTPRNKTKTCGLIGKMACSYV